MVVGLGYVGLSNAVLLAQANTVVGVDISSERLKLINEGHLPIKDPELEHYFKLSKQNLSFSDDLKSSVQNADYVIISTPTNYDEEASYFDTGSVESVIKEVSEINPEIMIVVRSTIPVGFIGEKRKKFNVENLIFCPEFLREGRAFYDNLYPSRIIVGDHSRKAKIFGNLLLSAAIKKDVKLLFTNPNEAEAIKLFSNSFLAMRVAFFNELDSFALACNLNSKQIIEGVSNDPRIGNYYNNPSFGYGGYCLPKDTKQLLENYKEIPQNRHIPQNMIRATVEANSSRQDFLAQEILKKRPKFVGVFGLAMKKGSDNFRESSIQGIMQRLRLENVKILIYEPAIMSKKFLGIPVENEIEKFKRKSDIILTNRMEKILEDCSDKVFTRDIFGKN